MKMENQVKKQNKAESVREFLTAFNNTLEQDGFLLNTVHFERDDNGTLTHVRMSYTETGKEADHAN